MIYHFCSQYIGTKETFCFETFCFGLLAVLNEESVNHQYQRDSSSWDHECLYKIYSSQSNRHWDIYVWTKVVDCPTLPTFEPNTNMANTSVAIIKCSCAYPDFNAACRVLAKIKLFSTWCRNIFDFMMFKLPCGLFVMFNLLISSILFILKPSKPTSYVTLYFFIFLFNQDTVETDRSLTWLRELLQFIFAQIIWISCKKNGLFSWYFISFWVWGVTCVGLMFLVGEHLVSVFEIWTKSLCCFCFWERLHL